MCVSVYMYNSFISFYIYTRTRRLLAPSNDARTLSSFAPHTQQQQLIEYSAGRASLMLTRSLCMRSPSLCHTAVTVTKVNDFLQALLLSSVALPRSSSLSLSLSK